MSSSNRLYSSKIYDKSPFSHSSMAIQRLLGVWKLKTSFKIQGCSKAFIILASETAYFTQLLFINCCFFITFKAKSYPLSFFRPLNTLPKDPCPITSIISKSLNQTFSVYFWEIFGESSDNLEAEDICDDLRAPYSEHSWLDEALLELRVILSVTLSDTTFSFFFFFNSGFSTWLISYLFVLKSYV